MPAPRREIELIAPGMDLSNPSKPVGWIQNLVKRNNIWVTRPGLGQLTQLDTEFGETTELNVHGYRKHLGSHIFKTSIGHTQIVSVLMAQVYHSSARFDTTETGVTSPLPQPTYLVSIYDVTARTRWEEALFTPSYDVPEDVVDIKRMHGAYETGRAHDYQRGPVAQDEPFCFTEMSDVLYLGNRVAGVWAYIPCIFPTRKRNTMGVSSHFAHCVHEGYGDQTVLTKLVARDGLYTDNYKYFSTSTWPAVSCFCELDNRLVMASGRTIYFSDPGFPNVIAADNWFDLGSRYEITDVQSIGSLLMIKTERETFAYAPNQGYIISAGKLEKLSDEVGCIGPNASCKIGDAVAWADRNGVYLSKTGLSWKEISEPIREFFRTWATNPLTSYYTGAGLTNLALAQPRMRYDFTDTDMVHLAYDAKYDQLMLSIPALDIVWVYSQGGWSIWNLESLAYSEFSSGAWIPKVCAVRNINNPWMLADGKDVYCVGAIDEDLIDDYTVGATNTNFWSCSYYIMRMGLGGGLDRSTVDNDDHRRGKGAWFKRLSAAGGTTGGAPAFYLGEPVLLEPNKSLTVCHDTAYYTLVVQAGTYRVPVYLNPAHVAAGGAIIPPALWEFRCTFDNTNWSVLREAAWLAGDVAYILPQEMQNVRDAFGQVAGGYFHTVNPGAPAVRQTGTNLLRVRFHHFAAPAANLFSATGQNAVPDYPNHVFDLLFRRATGADCASMGIVPTADCEVFDINQGAFLADVWVFERHAWANASQTFSNKKAQPVDWVYKAQQVAIETAREWLARGIAAKVLSRGHATTKLVQGWYWGLYNTLLGSDWKDWTSQIIDYTEDLVYVLNKDTLRSRIKPTTALVDRVLNGVATWGQTNDNTKGNYLNDEEQLDTIVTSDRVRGEHFSYMLFGHIMNKAERLGLGSLKAFLEDLGPRRRTGR